MSWWNAAAALIGAGASVYGASQQAGAAEDAGQMQWDMFDLQRQDSAPWRRAGGQAVNALAGTVTPNFQASPGYQFRVQEGINAIDNSAAARGMLGSGARLKELTRYGQGVAADEFTNWFNRNATIAGLGQTANQNSAAAGAHAATQAGNAGFVGATAWGQGVNNAVTAAGPAINGLANYWQKSQAPAYGYDPNAYGPVSSGTI